MLEYENFDQMKKELLEAQTEYLKKRDDLQTEKEQIIWNIEIFERMFGETDLFDKIKKINRDEKLKQYVQSQKYKKEYNTIAALLIIFFALTFIITYVVNSIIM